MDSEEKRKYRRLECSLEAKMRIDGKPRSVEVTDVNEHGARVQGGMRLPPGENTEIEIFFKEDLRLKVNCRIIWSSVYLSGYAMGIVFPGAEADVKEALKKSGFGFEAVPAGQVNRHKQVYDSIFESYSEEIFLRRVEEFVDYVKENDPKNSEWAEQLYKKLKNIIEEVLEELRKWAE
ncbi:MAG: PilZ domain-containing protein [Elusimicrobia bacterium]|nr:PilZ domain-containing protein [Elusimicrobiota bacterium]